MKSRFTATFALAALLFAGLAGALYSKVLSYEVRQDGVAEVEKVVAGSSADLILIGSGMEENFCTGAVCLAERNGVPVAELVIAEAEKEKSVALVTRLATNQMILTGDSVKLKTITF